MTPAKDRQNESLRLEEKELEVLDRSIKYRHQGLTLNRTDALVVDFRSRLSEATGPYRECS